MGLGKTIQTLARIVDGLPSKEDMKKSGFSKTTLQVFVLVGLPLCAHQRFAELYALLAC